MSFVLVKTAIFLICVVIAIYALIIFKNSGNPRGEEKMPIRQVLPVKQSVGGLRRYQKSIDLLYDHLSLLPGELDRSNRLLFYVQLSSEENKPSHCRKLFRDQTLGEFLITYEERVEKIWLVVESIINYEDIEVKDIPKGSQLISWIHTVTFLKIRKSRLKKMISNYKTELESK